MIKVLFVCMGNICRSPTAESVFRHVVAAARLTTQVEIDSAGTHGYHVGETPDPRMQQAALRRGYNISNLCGRQVGVDDCHRFDYILVMDRTNLRDIQRLCPSAQRHKVTLFLSYGHRFLADEVPDPYYGGAGGFDYVLDLVEDAAQGLLAKLKEIVTTAD